MDLKSAILIVIVLSMAGTALAVDPSSAPQETTRRTETIRTAQEGGPLPFPEQMVAGEITDSNGTKLGGVTVKLFADGRLVEITHTTAAGSFEMRLPLSIEDDESVVLWFVDSSGNYRAQYVVLKESSAAASANLFSDCIPEVRMRPQTHVSAVMLTEEETVASLKSKGCL
jgi:hypothetical protein